MNWNRKELKQKGMEHFRSNYWKCVLVAILLAITGNGGSSSRSSDKKKDENQFSIADYLKNPEAFQAFLAALAVAIVAILFVVVIVLVISIVVRILVLNPLSVGCERFFLNNAEYEDAALDALGCGFRNNYSGNVKTLFLRDLYLTLWTLLLVIPGIVKAYEYRMIPYLLADDPDMSTEEAFARSKEMMDGEKLNAFVLDLSFIGWHLLSAITFGIVGVFFTAPYMQATNAELYLALK